MNDLKELLVEYFELKDQDKAIRKERNEFMARFDCPRVVQNEERGDCISERVGGNLVEMCEGCTKRNDWYIQRQANSSRRGQIMRKLKRLTA